MSRESGEIARRPNGELARTPDRHLAAEAPSIRIVATRRVTPPVDIEEDGERIRIVADMPGMERRNLQVSVGQGVLTLEGFRDIFQGKRRDDGSHEFERIFYHRRFRLGSNIADEGISSTYSRGVLETVLPKSDVTRLRRVDVRW